MTTALASVDVLLAVAVLLLTAVIIGIRLLALRRTRWEVRLRPGVELALAEYLAGAGSEPAPTARDERAVLLTVALEALADLQGTERARLVALLEKLGYVTEEVAELSARSRVRRQQAAETLATLATPTAVSALEAGLADQDVLVRTAAARALAEAGRDDAIPAVVATARQDMLSEPGAAAAVVLALGMKRPDSLAPLLAPGTPAEVRNIAATVAGELRLAQYARELQDCLTGADTLAASAARGLGRIGDMTALGALSSLALDPERPVPVRAAAVTSLGAVGDPVACPVLEGLLQAPDWPLVAASATALAQLGEPGLSALQRATGSSRTDVSALAQAALEPR